jgi:hypothetical protein
MRTGHAPEAAGGKGCRIDGLERVDIGVDLQDGSLGRLHQRALRRPDGRLPTLRSSWLASTLPARRQRSILIIGN